MPPNTKPEYLDILRPSAQANPIDGFPSGHFMLLGHVIWLGCVQESKEAFRSWGPRDSSSRAQALGPSPSRCNVPKPARAFLFRDTEESITGQGGVSSQGILINEGIHK